MDGAGKDKHGLSCFYPVLFVSSSSKSLDIATTGQKKENNRWGGVLTNPKWYTQDTAPICSKNIIEEGAERLQEP